MFLRITFLGLALALALCGCKNEETAPAKAEAPAAAADGLTEAEISCLTQADKKDGKEDKVVSKCPSCMLKMSGSAEHASAVGDFTVHSCSKHCKHEMETSRATVFARLGCDKK